MNMDYSGFYRGTMGIPSYGSGAYQKDTLVKYEFHTTDEHGNKVMDKMSREETLQAMKDISSQYGDAVIVEFSGDGMAALVEGKKGTVDACMTQEKKDAMEARNAEFQKEITQIDQSIDLPAASKTEKGSYLGHGSNLVHTTNTLDMMRTMDSSAYEEYQKISQESSNEDRPLNTLKYLTNWYESAVKKDPSLVDQYEEQLEKRAKGKDGNAASSDVCTTNTDRVDKEIEKLKEQKKQLKQQIMTAVGDPGKAEELKKKLSQIERELSRKDNDAYRRQNAVVS